MNKFLSKNKIKFVEILFYFAIFLFTFISFIIIKPLYFVIRNGVIAQTFSLLCIVITIIVMLILKHLNKLNNNKIVFCLILISYFIHLGYMLYTPYDCRQYDTVVNSFDGHQGYAWTIYTTNSLPLTNSYQFYHPPLNAFIQSCFMHFSKNILLLFPHNFVVDMNTLYESCQILSVLYSMVIIVTGYKILLAIKIHGKGLFFSFIFICFFPRFIQLSAQLNNDLICIMFSVLALYYSIKWYQNHNYYHTIMLAISIGLSMMSKISGATICVTTAILFVLKLIEVIKLSNKKALNDLIIKYSVFFVICAPLGLWFQIYAKVRFNQNLGYVFDGLNSALSTADHNFFERFLLIINFEEIFKNVYCLPFENYSLLNYILKSAIFGEFNYWQGESFAIISIIFNYAFFFVCTALIIKYIKNSKKEDKLIKIIGLSIVITQILSIIYFYIKMPYGCTMDFRYIVPIVFGISILLGASINKLVSIKKIKLVTITCYITLGFLIFSNLFYLVCI